ncbi:MAG: sigma-54-dependent response regulator transcription factor ZraR [Acidobacteriota bacterium]
MARVLLVDEDPFVVETLGDALERAGHEVVRASGAGEALARFDGEAIAAVVAGLDGDGLDTRALLDDLRAREPGLRALVFGRRADEGTVGGNGTAVLARPFHVEDLVGVLERTLALEGGSETDGAGAGTAPAACDGTLLGHNPKIRALKELIETVGPATSAVLITGESGTGKGRVARAIHDAGPRAGAPFVRFDCSAFEDGLLEAELFGAEQGAVPGLARARRGAFRRADGGTLYLADVDALPAPTQMRLLRVVQERSVTPLGSDVAVPVDVRVVSGVDGDLAAAVEAGRFREDLFFRLGVIPIAVPALRERPDDIPELAEHLLRVHAAACGKDALEGFTPRAMRALERYAWPGNVRELENAVERAVVLARGSEVDLEDLPPELRARRVELDETYQLNTVRLAEVEEIVVRRVLTRTGWNIKRSAEILGITRATLYSKIRKFGLVAAR